jgi:hypothetical protein
MPKKKKVGQNRIDYYNDAADERQKKLHIHYQNDTFLGNPKNVNNFIEWVTFF